jgi:alanyl-tRNA synthetase
MPDSPEPALHQRRHEPVRAHLPRPDAEVPVHARPRGRHPEVHPRRRQAQRPRGRRARHLPPHVLRDARQLVLRRLLQARGHRLGWELVTKVWKFPARALYATVYKPDPAKGDPADFDQEAYDIWAGIFTAAGLDPAVHIVNGNKKDNFWMMGDTGPVRSLLGNPRGPHPGGDTRGALVNQGSAECIEIWNQRVHPVQREPRRHLLAAARQARGHRHGLRARDQHHPGHEGLHRLQEREDLELRDRHLPPDLRRHREAERQSTAPRCPKRRQHRRHRAGEDRRGLPRHRRPHPHAQLRHRRRHPARQHDRNYVLRRILRRAVRYGRTLGFQRTVLLQAGGRAGPHMGDVFPESAPARPSRSRK